MKFEKAESWKISGTHFMDGMLASYDQLVDVFGAPHGPSEDGKTRFNWVLEFDDGTIATIYDYKMPLFDNDKRVYWHVGGHNRSAWYQVIDIFTKTTQKGLHVAEAAV